jgi:transposase
LLFEAFAINLLKATQTVQGAAEILRTGWDATWNISERCNRGVLTSGMAG